ncbi:uncharacterized protein M421DRAFT_217452 [Didymella exigua CBS 183.55]|uniref:F-box domain-containing protein n=1 Tax=Didymella exigua CBS 183.55 TaxID=1150837 RepID=A0A6A5RHC1_9PLEO|nr:uncharacterized protein M421DRAFT_217452 [Didymella exigua CBS 183.55]KAF1926484.1 hypothetical protein M421DRAFT_217452 [Didymella exigua CBS 183.55]
MSKAPIVKVAASGHAQGSQRKCTVDNEKPKHPQKRPKLGQLRLQTDDKPQEYDNFQFLQLPPEVRNQVYEYATEHTHRCFPLLHGTPKNTRRRMLRSGNSTEPSATANKPIPYLGLTQVCLQIRAEFRPMWLSTHRVPLNFTESYFKAFFLARVPKVTRYNIFGLNTSSLRIWVRKDDLGTIWNGCMVTRLFKHKARFPTCAIACQSMPQTEEYTLRQLERLINHDDPVWKKAITTNKIGQVRLSLQPDKTTVAMHIVVKERFAEAWMKVLSEKPPHAVMEGFLRQFGFPADGGWEAQVSVDYS